MSKYPRLHVDEPEPPAPLPFPGRDAAVEFGVRIGGDTRGSGELGSPAGFDAAREAQASLERVERTLGHLRELNEEAIASFPFPGRHDDDDGPWAA